MSAGGLRDDRVLHEQDIEAGHDMSIGHDYIALLLLEERAARLQQEAAFDRTSRVVRGGRRRRRRTVTPVIPLQRRDESVSAERAVADLSDRAAS